MGRVLVLWGFRGWVLVHDFQAHLKEVRVLDLHLIMTQETLHFNLKLRGPRPA